MGKKPASTSDDKALSEVEHLLMRKTFTRVEFDRLTDLLRERTVESDLPTATVSHEEKNEGGARTNGRGGSTLHGTAADYSPPFKIHSLGVNSPAELAKQYMSSRYSQEPQSSSLRSRLFLENKGEASNVAYDGRSGHPVVRERIEFGSENSGIPVNGYATPGIRGRSAIYRMSRSPYFKGPGSSGDANMSSLSQRAQSLHAGGRQVLKRRAADFENEHGPIGPIRRIRQKSNMMSSFRDARANPQGNLIAGRRSGSDFTEDSSPIQESPSLNRLMLGTGQSVRPHESHKGGGDIKSSDTIPTIPPQSNKMAEKIFEQLNIIAPSPKEKQSGKQSVSNNLSPSMSKEPVWQDNGGISMGDPSTSLKIRDSDGVNKPLVQELSGSKKGKLKLTDDGSSKVASPDKHTILGNSTSAATSRKPGFKMAVFEDLTELDDDLDEPIPSKNSPSKIEVGRNEQKFDSSNKDQKVEQKVGPNLFKDNVVGSPVSERPIAPVPKAVSSSGLFSPNDPGKTNTALGTAENNTGFTFSYVSPSTPTESTTSALPVTSVKDNKQSAVSTSIFGLKQSNMSDLGTSTAADVKNKAGPFQSVTKTTAFDSTSSERGDNRERTEDVIQSSDASATLSAPLHFTSNASSSSSLSNGLTPAVKPALSSAPSTSIFGVGNSSPAISSASPAAAFSFGSSASVSSSMAASVKSESAEAKPATTLTFGIGSTAAEAKSTVPDSTSKPPSKLVTSPISSNISTFSSPPTSSASIFSTVSTFSSSPVAASTTTTAPSGTSSSASGVQSASTAAFTLSSSGNMFGFSSPAQSTGQSTSVAPSTPQPPVASAVFGSKPPQSETTVSQPTQSPVAQFGSSFPTSGVGASSSGPGTISASSGTMSFGVGTSSSAPGTPAFGAAASSSGPGIFSFGAGTSSSGSGTVSFGLGAGAASSAPGTVSFGAGAASSGPGTVSFGIGATSSGPGTVSFGSGTTSTRSGAVSFGVGAASSGPGTVSFGVGAASSGSGAFSFGAGASSSGPGTVSLGATTSASGSAFGSSQFGAGSTFSTPFSSSSGTGFAFSSPSPSSSAISSTVASTSVFSNSSAASSTSLSNPFGSNSSSPTFTFGQPASSGGAFAFGAQSAPAFSSQPPVFAFPSASTSTQPAFGLTNTNTGFGMGSTGNDQMSEDNMADDTNQATPTPAPVFGSSPFGQQGNSPAAPIFGAPSVQPGGVFQFGGQQQGSAPQNPAFPPPGGSLEFQGGGFSLGSAGGGGDKSGRRVIKVKRASKKR